MLENIKLELGILDDAKDGLLGALIERCSREFKAITHTDEIIESVVEQMVIYHYSRIGTAGLNSESYTGANYNYTSDYPTNLYRDIISYRKIRVVK